LDLNDFSDTAALISEMDLIVSADTSVAHLAGAMGKPIWIMIPYLPDYRWLLDRTDSPWYPAATLFRQPAFDDWKSVISAIVRRLQEGFQPSRP
jgi:ADP-heptose:LPS heptosyltransferase